MTENCRLMKKVWKELRKNIKFNVRNANKRKCTYALRSVFAIEKPISIYDTDQCYYVISWATTDLIHIQIYEGKLCVMGANDAIIRYDLADPKCFEDAAKRINNIINRFLHARFANHKRTLQALEKELEHESNKQDRDSNPV